MKKHFTLLWITGLILGWFFDLLFWKQAPGINFAIYSFLCVLGALAVLLVNKQYPARGSLWLFPLILVFAALTVIRSEPMTTFLGVVFTLLLMLVLSNTYLGGRWLLYGLADYLYAGLKTAGSMVARPVTLSNEIRKDRAEAGIVRKGPKVWPYLRGLAIALPILAIFASLLAAADAAFSSELDAFLRFFAIQNLPQYIFRLAYILVGAYMLVGLILHASARSDDSRLLGDDKPIVGPFLGFTEATIVLGSVVILFAAFVLVQFRYFFGGQANITVAGFTYAEYARRGFGELIIVAFFSLLMILGLETVTRRALTLQRRVVSGLSATIVALVMVMLVSAYQRLVLYESAYGFSRLRTYTHVALVWIALLLGAVVVLAVLQRQRAFMAAMLIASLGFALSLAALNVDALIVTQNVNRAVHGQELDVPYIVSLSTDSVAPLVRAYDTSSMPESVRLSIGAALFCRIHSETGTPSGDWRSFTFSRWQADAALRSVEAKLQGYKLIDNDWPRRVVTPGGPTYDCYAPGMD